MMLCLKSSVIYHGINCVVFTSVVFIVTCISVLFDLTTYLFLSLNIAEYIFAIEQKVCMMLLLLLLSFIKISLYFLFFSL